MGNVMVAEGGSQTFTITPNSGYLIQQVLIDGSPVAVLDRSSFTHTFDNVDADRTIHATFREGFFRWNSAAPTGLLDGDTVIIESGAAGTLIVPTGATVTIIGGTESSPVTNTNQITLSAANATVNWEAHYSANAGVHSVLLQGINAHLKTHPQKRRNRVAK
jgi:hypothetical protein